MRRTKAAARSAPAHPAPSDPATTITVPRNGAESIEETAGEILAEGICSNVVAAVDFSSRFGPLDLTKCAETIHRACAKVTRDNDLSGVEAMLTAQLITTNAMFTHLAAQASRTPTLENYERYMRLALKAQSQSRATAESLAFIKNPGSAVFAKQANIANGPQQVNNGAAPAARPPEAAEPARGRKRQFRKTKLLRAANGARVDSGTAGTAAKGDPAMAPMGAVNRAKNGRR